MGDLVSLGVLLLVIWGLVQAFNTQRSQRENAKQLTDLIMALRRDVEANRKAVERLTALQASPRATEEEPTLSIEPSIELEAAEPAAEVPQEPHARTRSPATPCFRARARAGVHTGTPAETGRANRGAG